MRRIYQFLLATVIAAAPMPVTAQVSVDLNALNGLAGAALPTPPPAAGSQLATHRHRHMMRHLAGAAQDGRTVKPTAIASAAAATQTPAGPRTIEHPSNLGPSFTSLPALPGAAPPALRLATPAEATSRPAPKPVETAPATPKPAAPQLALPGAAPPAPATPTRLAEATPVPPAARLPSPAKAPKPNTLPKGADQLTLPFFVQQSDLPSAEGAMLRDFAERYGADAEYTVRAFASSPEGDDDPSTPRRIALARAQSVAAALLESGVQGGRVRLLALGNAGGTPADRVEVIAMPPASSHTNANSSP